MLGDQALPTVRQHVAVQRAPVSRPEIGQPQQRGAGVAEDALQPRATRGERQRAHVGVAVAQDVERDERDGLGVLAPADLALRREVNPSLQPLKAGRLAVLIERDDLAVEQHVGFQPAREHLERAGDLGELRGLVVAEARP